MKTLKPAQAIGDVINKRQIIMDGLKAVANKLDDKDLHELIQYLIDLEVKRKGIKENGNLHK